MVPLCLLDTPWEVEPDAPTRVASPVPAIDVVGKVKDKAVWTCFGAGKAAVVLTAAKKAKTEGLLLFLGSRMGVTPVDITELPGVVSNEVTPPDIFPVERPAGGPKVTTKMGAKEVIDTSTGQVYASPGTDSTPAAIDAA